MARGLLIIGTGAKVGKTLLGCALAFAAHSRAIRVGVMKPVDLRCETIGGALESPDAVGLAFAAATHLAPGLICPFRNVLPEKLDQIAEPYEKIAASNDLVVVEGGGISETVARDDAHSASHDYADLARMLDLEVVIVTGNRPGCVDATVATIEYARTRGNRIVGYILNDTEASVSDENQQSSLRITDIPFLGRVLLKQPVPRAIIDALLTPV
jgi:dethiobiotin synthetase